MPRLKVFGPATLIVLLSGCGSSTPVPALGNLSDERGAHAGGFESSRANTADAGNAAEGAP